MDVPAADAKPEFVRRVVLDADPGRVRASVEDHQHHFVVTVHHDGTVVEGFEVEGRRVPWSTCLDAEVELAEWVGAPIGVRPTSGRLDQHCTHQVDVAQVAVRFAGLGLSHRDYDLRVHGYLEPVTHASLVRDDGYEIHWTLEDATVTAPPAAAGRSLRDGFSGWVGGLPPDDAEAMSLLRRAVWLAPSRLFELDGYETMAEVGMPVGVCWSAQPERIEVALRVRGAASTAVPDPGDAGRGPRQQGVRR